jgi:hypothetical protein
MENIMRALVCALALGCCMAAAAGAAEKTLPASDLQDFRGQYDLADGRLLTVTQRGNKLFVRMNDEPEIEVVPAGDGVFVTRWGKVRLEFDQRANGSVAGVRLRGPDRQVASGQQ